MSIFFSFYNVIELIIVTLIFIMMAALVPDKSCFIPNTSHLVDEVVIFQPGKVLPYNTLIALNIANKRFSLRNGSTLKNQ